GPAGTRPAAHARSRLPALPRLRTAAGPAAVLRLAGTGCGRSVPAAGIVRGSAEQRHLRNHSGSSRRSRPTVNALPSPAGLPQRRRPLTLGPHPRFLPPDRAESVIGTSGRLGEGCVLSWRSATIYVDVTDVAAPIDGVIPRFGPL